MCKELNELNFTEKTAIKNLHDEAIQVAAVAVAIIEHISTAMTIKRQNTWRG